MRSKYLALLLASGLGALLALGGCQGTSKVGTAGAGNDSGAPPVEVSATLPGLDGMDTSIAQYKGKVVVVNFWATWCQPCKVEIPWLIEFNQKYGPKGLVILGVSMDDEGEKVVQPWVQSQRFDVNGNSETMNYPILLGNTKIAEKFGGILGMPTSMLYSRDGKKIKTIVGLIDHDDLSKTLDSQL